MNSNSNTLQEYNTKYAIGEDIILFDNISKVPFFDYPIKVDYSISTICIRGEIGAAVNLKSYKFSANDFIILVPGQIVQFFSVSEDFYGLHIIMSQRFTDNLEISIKNSVSVFLHLKENHVMHLKNEEMESLLDYYDILLKALKRVESPNRLDIARALTLAMFYGINGFEQLQNKNNTHKSKKEVLFDSFYNLILQHHKESREVGFYAEKLCMNPKYLSTVIKEISGKSAFEWINNYVILEAKSMLKSTGKTIQQISDELNFANQSFFGKYFKQHVGIPPSEYRIQ